MFFPRDMKLSDITEAIENVMKPNRHTLIKKNDWKISHIWAVSKVRLYR